MKMSESKNKTTKVKRHNPGGRNRTIKDTFRSMGGFCGWDVIEDTYNNIANSETKQIFNGIFELGCRAMELPLLTRGQVDLDSSDTWIRIRAMYVLKQKEILYLENSDGSPMLGADGKRKYTFNSIPGYRSFPIRKDNPLAQPFIDYVKKFPNKSKSDRETILYPYTYNQIYYRIATIGMELPEWESSANWTYYKGPWWPHRLRGERACQLIRDLRFDLFRLMGWFGWSSEDMPVMYGTIQGAGLEEDRKVVYR